MVSMVVVFYMFIIVFAIAGAMRGWAKELLVIFSVVLSLAFIVLVEQLVPGMAALLKGNTQIWFRLSVLMVIVLFGYQSPRLARLSKAAERKERIQDILLGLVLGAVSGYMVIGTVWWFFNQANYPFIRSFIVEPKDAPNKETILRIINMLPPVFLGKPTNVFIAVVLAFIFVIVVFV
jgi:hypothetical protein